MLWIMTSRFITRSWYWGSVIRENLRLKIWRKIYNCLRMKCIYDWNQESLIIWKYVHRNHPRTLDDQWTIAVYLEHSKRWHHKHGIKRPTDHCVQLMTSGWYWTTTVTSRCTCIVLSDRWMTFFYVTCHTWVTNTSSILIMWTFSRWVVLPRWFPKKTMCWAL